MSDTDSFVFEIRNQDLNAYTDFIKERKEMFDTSNYPKTHELFTNDRKKQLGTFTEEAPIKMDEDTILDVKLKFKLDSDEKAIEIINKLPTALYEWLGLSPKCYAPTLLGKVKPSTIKGAAKVIRNTLGMEAFKETMFGGSPMYESANFIRADGHDTGVKKVKKKVISAFTDKRFQIEGEGFLSIPYNHYTIHTEAVPGQRMREIRSREAKLGLLKRN